MSQGDNGSVDTGAAAHLFAVQRLGVVMAPDPARPEEAWGVLNPACARDPAGNLLLFPRLVAAGNYSRIGIARVLFSENGDPQAVERMGYALEPTESYEINRYTAGCEDPRITFVRELNVYVMAYTAYGPLGSRIALARSTDLITWTRLGLVKFAPEQGVEFDFYVNKDALIFPELIEDPHGRPSIGLIHRPDYDLQWFETGHPVVPTGIADSRPSMWLSYCPVDLLDGPLDRLPPFRDHHLLATPQEPWEQLKIGGGTAPLRTQHGWLTLYHGVSGEILRGVERQEDVYYKAGALMLDSTDPRRILYRSSQPVLEPQLPGEREGMIANVVFPTAVDQRDESRVDVYYGMADSRIGVGVLHLPERLPPLRAQDANREAAACCSPTERP